MDHGDDIINRCTDPQTNRAKRCSENLATCSALHVWTANALASGTVPGATSVIVFVSPSDVLSSSRLAPPNTEDRSVQASVPRDRGRRSHPEVGPRPRGQPEGRPKGPRAGATSRGGAILLDVLRVRSVDLRCSTLQRDHKTEQALKPGDVVVVRPAG